MQAERYPTESALLSGAAGGDPDAVRALIDSIGPVVYGFVFARVGGDEPAAQDLLQETLIEALRSAPTFRGDASLRTWVCAIARRRLARHYEAERRQAVAESGLALLGGIGGFAGLRRRARRGRAARRDRPGPRPPARRPPPGPGDEVPRRAARVAIADEMGRSPVQVQSLLQRARDGLRRASRGGVPMT